ncbi:DHHW family protein [Paenibacillaceae bacterium WGS1546]|uniref:DHHW family protein n=1 Tax=Cohnella sp. WGS1546 TaxID=3366810 RepID=UPI00372CFA76
MKLRDKLNLILFLVLIFGIAAVNLLKPPSESTSDLEQRELMAMPEFSTEKLFEGSYTRDFDNYFADNFAFRSSLVQVGSSMKDLKGFQDENRIHIVVQGGDNMGGNNVSASQYLILRDRAFIAFKSSAEAIERYADTLNQIADRVGPDVNVYSLLAPSSVEFSGHSGIEQLTESQKEAIDQINLRLDASIVQVDAYAGLAAHQDEYIYFRTDHHWSALGAYYAYVQFMEAIGEQPIPLEQYQKEQIPEFLGTAYKQTLNDRLERHPDTIEYYLPFTEYQYMMHTSPTRSVDRNLVDPNFAKYSSTDYAVFLGGDYPWGEIVTDNKNGKRVVVVKDSYANAFVPFLLPHFEKVYYLDPRHYHANLLDFIQEQEITDVLFLNNTSVARNTGLTQQIIDKMNK